MEKEILERIQDWLQKKPMPPYQLEINPTNLCNLHCLPCEARGKPFYNSEEEKRITLGIYKSIIDEAASVGVKIIHLSGGGEPLAADKTIYIMEYIKQNNIKGSIVTNGTLFNEYLIKKLIMFSWDVILYSIDGADAKTHDYIRNYNGAFKKIIESIKQFNYYKSKLKNEKPELWMCLVLNSYNYKTIREYMHLAYSLNIKKIFIQPIRIKNDTLGKSLLLSEQQQKIFNDSIGSLLKEALHYGIETNLDEFDAKLIEKSSEIHTVIESYLEKKTNNLSSLPCYSPWYFMAIKPNGNVYPCGVDSSHHFGNIVYNNLTEMWYGDAFNNFREKLLRKDLPAFCKECCGMTVMQTKKIQNSLN